MFKMIGAMVVYGFALYGVVESADWLTSLMDQKSKTKSLGDTVADQINEVLRKHGNGPAEPA